MKKLSKGLLVVTFCVASTGCATKALKAPCGPSASLANPCDSRTPINDDKHGTVGLAALFNSSTA